MKKILFAIAALVLSSGLVHAQTDTIMYLMKGGVIIQQHSINSANVDSIIFHKPATPILSSSNFQTAYIPAGIFSMGSPSSETGRVSYDEIRYQVTLKPFRICKYEITNDQFAAFLNAKKIGSDGIYAAGAYPTRSLISINDPYSELGLHYYGAKWVPVIGAENLPATMVTWYGATEFATYAGGTLPTEAQWEYACRAGTTTTFNTGSCLTNENADYDWQFKYGTCINSVIVGLGKPQPVGSYAPNAYGLYDMHGNVAEWCSDWYDTYPTTAKTDPKGPTAGVDRIYRGGAFCHGQIHCRSAFRGFNTPGGSSRYIGFRVAFVQ